VFSGHRSGDSTEESHAEQQRSREGGCSLLLCCSA
jgi:hypothetical protein